MSYKITREYCWYDNGNMLVRMYMINGVPFTFDELPEIACSDPEILRQADKNRDYSPEELFYASFYLIDEECHPCIFDVELENPEDMPDDEYYCDYNEEDLLG